MTTIDLPARTNSLAIGAVRQVNAYHPTAEPVTGGASARLFRRSARPLRAGGAVTLLLFAAVLSGVAGTAQAQEPPDVTLSALAVNQGETATAVELTPTFSADETDYRAWVANGVSQVTVTATANHAGASLAIANDPDADTPGTALLDLAEGRTTLTVTVTAENDSDTKTYTVVVVREASAPTQDANALLTANVTVGEGNGIIGYFARVLNSEVGALTDGALNIEGTPNGMNVLVVQGATGVSFMGANMVTYCFRALPPAPEVLDRLVLSIGAAEFSFADASMAGTLRECFNWPRGSVSWAWGDIALVKVRLEAAANNPATGAPAITGTARVGQTLTASTSGIADADGLTSPTYSYQWIRVNMGTDADIDGATSATYVLAAADEANTIKVRVSFQDDASNDESLTSEETDAIVAADANYPATGAPTLSGEELEGRELTASTSGIADADGLTSPTYEYTWIRVEGGVKTEQASGTDSTYELMADDVGMQMRVRVDFQDDEGNAERLESALTGVIAEDTAPPMLVSAEVNGDQLRLNFDEQLLNENTPDPDSFSLRDSSNNPITVELIQAGRANLSLILTLATAAVAGETYTLEYTVPDGEETRKLQDRFQNFAPAFTGYSVTNNTPDAGENNAPTASDKTVETTRNTAYPFKASDFNFSDTDDGDALASVTIVTLPATDRGTLALDGTAVTVNQVVTNAQLGNGDLTYTPPDGEIGTGFASFTFRVSDGTDLSASAYTMTINVLAATVNTPAVANEVWSGTVTVGVNIDVQPNRTDRSAGFHAGMHGQLDDTTLEFNGGTHSISLLHTDTRTESSSDYDRFEISLSTSISPFVVNSLTLHVGTYVLPFEDATALFGMANTYRWTNPGLSWFEGDRITLRISGEDDVGPILQTGRLTSPRVNGATLELTYDGALDGTSVPEASAYSVSVDGGAGAQPSAVAVSGSMVTLTLATAVSHGDTVTLDYTVPTTNPIQDADGNDAMGFTDRAVENNTPDTTAPTLEEAEVDGATLVLTYDEDLDGSSVPATTAYSVSVDGGTGAAPSAVEVDDDEVTLTLASAVTAGQTVTVSYTAPGANPLRDEAQNNAAALTNRAVENNTPDTMAPNLVGDPSVDGLSLVLTYDEALDGTSVPAASAYSVSVDGGAGAAPSTVAVSGSAVTLTLATALGGGEDVTLDYTVPATNPIQDADGNEAAAFSGQHVDNHTRGVFITPTSLTVTEGASQSYMVRLTTEPTEEVTVTPSLAAGGDEDLTLDSANALTFDFDNWDRRQTVTVSAAEDADTENGTATINHAVASSGDYNGVTAPSVTVTEMDTTVTNNPATGAPTISGTETVGETLTASTTGIADTDGLTSPTYSYQWIRVDGGTDADIDGATSATYVLVAADEGNTIKVRVSFQDDASNDESLTSAETGAIAAADTTPPALSSAAVDGTTLVLTYNEELDQTSEPNTDRFRVQDSDEFSFGVSNVDVSGSTVTLTLSTAVSHSEAVTVTYLVPASNRIQDLAGNAAAALSAQAVDNNTRGVLITPTSLTVTEGGSADYSVVLATEPTADVMVTPSLVSGGDEDLTLASSGALTFTASTWNRAQTVTVNAAEDTDSDNGQATINHAVASTGDYSGVTAPSVTVTESDTTVANNPATGAPTISGTETVGETLTAATSGIADTDGLTGATYSYQWIRVDGGTETDISGATSATYVLVAADEGNTIKVRVSFQDDASNDESLTSAETGAIAAADTTAPELDGDPSVDGATLVLTYDESLDDTSTPATSAYSVSVDSGAGVAPSVVAMSNRAVTLTLATAVEAGQSVTLDYTVPGTNPIQDEAENNAAALSGRAVDNNTRGVLITPTSLTVTEGASADYNVVLATEPTADVMVTPSLVSGGDEDLTLASSGALTFTASTWNRAQTVTVNAAEDTDSDNGEATINHAVASSGDYNGVTAPSVTVTESDTTVANNPATGAPTISGTETVGETLTAATSGIADTDGLTGATYSYQWIRVDGGDETDIDGATSATYVLVAADEGNTIKVRVSFQDDASNDESLTSAETGAIAAAMTEQSDDATLSALAVNQGETATAVELTPTFSADETDYRGWVANGVSQVTVTATANHSGASLAIANDPDAVTPGTALLDLAEGRTTLTVTVTAENSDTETYTVVVVREASAPTQDANALLTANVTVGETNGIIGYFARVIGNEVGALTDGALDIEGSPNGMNVLVVQNDTRVSFLEPNKVTYCFRALPPAQAVLDRLVLSIGAAEFPFADASGAMNVRECFNWPRGSVSWAWGDIALVKVRLESSNNAATGAPAITGTETVGETLTASKGTIADDDGLTKADNGDDGYAYAYQWIRVDGTDEDDIAGAESASYTLVAADEGKTLKVRASFRDDLENDESLTSAATGAIAAADANNPATGAPTISGTETVGETLTASTAGIADADGLTSATYSYQWIRVDGGIESELEGATATARSFELEGTNEGKRMKVRVSFQDDLGNDETLESALTGVIAPDTTPPMLVSAEVNGNQLTLTFDEILVTGIGSDAGRVSLVDSNGGSITGTVAIVVDPPQAIVTLETAAVAGETYTVNYAVPDRLSARFRDRFENYVAAISGYAVTNNTRGVVITPTSLTVNEGASADYTVVLATEPTADVMVTPSLAPGGDGDLTLDSTSALTFTSTTWNRAQTVTVNAADDADGQNGEATINHAVASSGDYSGVTAPSVTVTESDTDAANTPATGAPSITGDARVGQTLTASTTGIADADGLSSATYSYQWIRVDGGTETEIAGETSATYVLAVADQGNTIKVRVSFQDDKSNDESLTSAETGAIVAADANYPATGAPTISGEELEGQVLTASTAGIADADGLNSPTYSYQWIRVDGGDETEYATPTVSSYELTSSDSGARMKVRVSFQDDLGNDETLESALTGVIADDTTPPMLVSAEVNGNRLTLTFDEDLIFSTGRSAVARAFSLRDSNANTVTGTSATGRDTPQIIVTLATAAVGGETYTLNYTPPPGGIPVEDPFGNQAAAISDYPVTNNTPVADTTPPTLSSAAVDGTTLVLTYDEALDESSVPANTAYSVSVAGGSGAAPSNVAVRGSAVTLTLATAVGAGQTVTLDYTVPGTNPIQDAASNEAAALSGRAVDNNTRGVLITPTSLTVTEGASADYSVVLATEPTADVTVTPSLASGGDGDLTLDSSNALTFTSSTWNMAQMVTVNAAADTDSDNGEATINHAVASSGDYNGVTAPSVTVTESDTTVAEAPTLSDLVLTQHGNAVALSPAFVGTTTSYTATVANSISSVTVTATRSDDDDTVDIAGDSDETTPDTATFSLTAGATETITVTVTAQDSPARTYTLAVEREALQENELLSATLTVRDSFGLIGCTLQVPSPNKCSDSETLSANSFTLDGTTHEITSFLSTNVSLTLTFGSTNSREQNLILQVDATEYAFSDGADAGTSAIQWSESPGWSAGDTVSIRIFEIPDTTPPALEGAAVDGVTLVLTYDEALDTASVPAATAYSVSVDGGAGAAPSAVAVSGSAVTLTLSAAVANGDTVTLDYTVPGSGPVQDDAGNDAAALTSQAVVNNTEAAMTPPPPQVDVPSTWSLIPSGLGTGHRFRLMFVTSTTGPATSSDIGSYNSTVQTRAAAGHADIQSYSSGFRVVGSTGSVNANDNTGTRFSAGNLGHPIYWLNGNKVADNYSDFYDASWDDETNLTNEFGSASTAASIWTGSTHAGNQRRESNVSRALGGRELVQLGRPNSPGENGPIGSNSSANRTAPFPLYGLSQVFRVAAPPVNNAATGAPAITGAETVGETLTASKGTIDDDDGLTKADNGDTGFAYAYQWIRVDGGSDSDIDDATSSTYVLVVADQGNTIKVRVDFQDDLGNDESLTSEATGTIAAADTTPPELQTITVNGDTIVATYDEALNGASTPAIARFQVFVDSINQRTISDVEVSGQQVTLTLDTAVFSTDSVSVIYVPVAAADGIEDTSGNRAISFRRTSITNNTAPLGNLVLNVAAIATDNTINIAEKAAGFAISGDTGSEGGVAVSVQVGSTTLPATSADADPATWSVDVPADATYITGTSVEVTVSASKTGFTAPDDEERTLVIDLVAPTAPTYTAPTSLKVGEAITAMTSSGGTDIDGYAATGLPSGLSIDSGSGAISGTPDAANAATVTATVTVSDTAGNTDTVNIVFPAVDKGDQVLTGFQYSAAAVSFGSAAPTVTAPGGAQTALSYSAAPDTVCTVNASTGALTLLGSGECEVTVTAEGTDDYNAASVTFTVTVQAAGNLVLNVAAIATDNTVNIAEKAAGFAISGDTGSEGGVAVSVQVGSTTLPATSADADPATWSVDVPADATYITGTSVEVTVSASKTGFTAPDDEERTLVIDLVAPTAPTYTAPASLKVGEAITAMTSSGGTDIDGYAATGLPSGLSIDSGSGAISGTPDAANAATVTATVTVSDTAGNTDTVNIVFPAVDKGDQVLTGFQYSAAAVSFGSAAPTVTAPAGAQTALSYSATSSTVCTVNASTGALTIIGVGSCVVTATAAADSNYNEVTATFTVTVQAAGNLVLNVNAIAGDETVNIAEKAAGFTISGDTGSEGGVLVTVTAGTGVLTATSSSADPATWSVSVPAGAAYITGTSVAVTVSATKSGFTPPSDETRTLAIDLVAPTAPAYTAPGSLKVGEAITAMTPSGGADIDGYGATGLPSGLSINSTSGAISGTPVTADASTATATVTVSDTAGNTATANIVFPAVDKGDQTLSGFQYSASSVAFGSAAPTVTAPAGAQTALSYSTTSSTVCTVNASTGALTLVGPGACVVTATAADTSNYNEVTATFTVTVQAAGNIVLNVNAIATDNTVNIAEKASGFTISGNTGSEGGVSVTVTVGATVLPATSTTADPATWSVSVPAGAAYITGTSVAVTVSATKSGFTPPSDETRTLAIDLVAPTAPAYTAPGSLKVGEAITAMTPSGGADIDGYGATGLPSGLSINSTSGAISGTPVTADASTATATVTVSDTAGNTATANIVFPAVDKGDQTLSGFQYSASSVAFGSAAPTVTAPAGAQTALSYSTTSSTVCTVNASTGALTLVGPGACVVTATAADTSNYNEVTATFTVTVQAAGNIVLNVNAIATDNTVNIAEKASGFTISGNTGSEGGVSVTVTVGATVLPATSTTADPATWSVSVPAGAAYITGTSVAVTVSATKSGFTPPSDETRTLAIDLVAPTAPAYTAPGSLKVGEAITAMTPSGGADIDGYGATGLPSGLSINSTSGAISGTPVTADASTATATVTVSDTAGNTATANIVFPAVDKGDQTLSGFQYSASSVAFGSAAPTVTAPAGAQTALSYSTTSSTVCTVNASTGALTLVGPGACVVTATAADTSNYNEVTATFTVTVQAAGNIVLNVNAIATDNTVNIAEKASGFTISGNTGSEGGVSVTVTVGATVLPATSTTADPATWSVSVPAGAAYITGTSVAVTVSATKSGFTPPSDETRTLAIDLVAPTAPAYTAPGSLKVGEAITAMTPSGGADIDGYGATGLPSGLSINSTSGAISGTPVTADASTATATVTVSDTAGNTATANIVFPAVDKGDQTLSGFQYSAASVAFGSAAPTVTAPGGAQTALSYSASPSTVCTVAADTGALTLIGAGSCLVTATAEGTDDYNTASVTFTVTVQAAGNLVLNVAPIAGDNTINIAEKAAGFTISGDTGSEGGVSVSVQVGSTTLPATSADADPATWTVSVPADAAYITAPSVEVTVSASKTGFTAPSDEERTLVIDLVAPTAPTYTAPATLTVGEAITAINPTGGVGIDEYTATGLPSGLSLNSASGAISGTPDTANAATATATVTVSDSAGNTDTVDIVFPAVDKGDQTLTGFEYSASEVMLGGAAPTVTAPGGAQTALSYSASPSTVCTVAADTGALTLIGAGSCLVTATAEGTDDYNTASVTFTVTVQAAGNLVLNVAPIAGDNTINIAEKAAGFTISGNTGSEGGVSVSVQVGSTTLPATSADADPATWTVSVPADAAYITGTSVAVTVSASKTGFTAPSDEERTLVIDLVAPTAPTYTAPATLTVGEAIAAINPSGGADIDGYAATGLPSGLSIDTGSGAISGTPDAANAVTVTATVTVSDTAGNPATVNIVLPAVDKGDQALTGFAYSAASVSFGSAAPTVTAPGGAQTALSYSASPSTVCTVAADTGALTLIGAGSCLVTATAEGTDDYNTASVTFTVTVQAAGSLVLNVAPIAGDNTINIAEHEAGFTINGDTGSEGGVDVSVQVGSTTLPATSADTDPATWTVSVRANAAYITAPSVEVTVSASKTGFTAPSDEERTLVIDLVAPTAPTYTAPATLTVGEAITAMTPSGGADIDGYAATGLPSGLIIDSSTGVISGAPDAADAGTATATVTVSDSAGNTDTVDIVFPAVDKGDQTLTGFEYSASEVMLGGAAPTVTAPGGAQTALSYSASPDTVCTVNASTGALTLIGAGSCLVTATAEGTDDYNTASVTFTVTVQAAGNLVLNVAPIAGDNTINIAEHEAGFTINGDTGSEGGVSVSVQVGSTTLPATSADADPATWSVSVPADAAYITGTSVAVTVSASKTGFTAPSDEERTLVIDLAAPTAPAYTAPASLKVGEAITAMTPSGGADIDGYAATGLPSGLSIDAGSGAISGTPATANAATVTATVTVSDSAGNEANASIAFPAVDKGDQTLTGFEYSASEVMLGGAAPTVTAPGGAQTALSYSASPSTVCTVAADTGALTLIGAGSCLVTVTAAGSDDYSEATATFTVTVRSASALVTLTVSDESVAENAGSVDVTVTATLDAQAQADTEVTVSVGAAGDSAASGEDYAAVADFTLTIAAGATTGTASFALAVTDDDVDEDAETLSVSGTAEGLSVTGTAIAIEDDDARGVTLSAMSLTVERGQSSDYTVVLNSEPTGTVTVTPTVSDNEYATVRPAFLAFSPANWYVPQSFTVTLAEDAATTTVTVSHAVSGSDYESETVEEVTVDPEDPQPDPVTVALSVEPASVAEDAGGVAVEVSAALTGTVRESDIEIAVSVGAADDSAARGSDYSAEADITLTIAAGENAASASFTLTPIDDREQETVEVLTLSGATSSPDVTIEGAEIAIEDNDEPSLLDEFTPELWLARFGRAATDQTLGAIGARFRAEAVESHLTVAGRRVDNLFGQFAAAAGASGAAHGGYRLPGQPGQPGGACIAAGCGSDASVGSGLRQAGGASSAWAPGTAGAAIGAGPVGLAGASAGAGGAGLAGFAGVLGLPDLRNGLMNSSFSFSQSGGDGAASGATAPAGAQTDPQDWTLWGQMGATQFQGEDGALSLDGNVNNAMLGADLRRGRWLVGAAVSHAVGEGEFAGLGELAGGDAVAVNSTLTTLNPYAFLELGERSSLWAAAGYGTGTLELLDGDIAAIETDLNNVMAAFGGRGVVRTAGALELALVSDARWTRTESEAALGDALSLAGGAGSTSRVRLMLEGSRQVSLASGAVLTPSLEAGLRYDGGDAETGAGVELGAALAFASGRLSLDLSARMLLRHEEAAYEEWGASGQLAYRAGEDGRGLSVNLGSSWGVAQSGVHALWSRQAAHGLASRLPASAPQRLDFALGYGLAGKAPETLWVPYLSAQAFNEIQSLLMGVKLTRGTRFDAALNLGIDRNPLGDSDPSFELAGRMLW